MTRIRKPKKFVLLAFLPYEFRTVVFYPKIEMILTGRNINFITTIVSSKL
jgi:hypothetical protein